MAKLSSNLYDWRACIKFPIRAAAYKARGWEFT